MYVIKFGHFLLIICLVSVIVKPAERAVRTEERISVSQSWVKLEPQSCMYSRKTRLLPSPSGQNMAPIGINIPSSPILFPSVTPDIEDCQVIPRLILTWLCSILFGVCQSPLHNFSGLTVSLQQYFQPFSEYPPFLL